MVKDAWKNFELSGKVTDYLEYRQGEGQPAWHQAISRASRSERGMDRYGTEHSSDGNGNQCHADWRL